MILVHGTFSLPVRASILHPLRVTISLIVLRFALIIATCNDYLAFDRIVFNVRYTGLENLPLPGNSEYWIINTKSNWTKRK